MVVVQAVTSTLILLTTLYFWFDRSARRRLPQYRQLAEKGDVEGVPWRIVALTMLTVLNAALGYAFAALSH